MKIIRQIKKFFYGKNCVEIRTATMNKKEISYFMVKHPFLTRKEVNHLMSTFHKFIKEQGDTKYELVFEEKPTIIQKIKKQIKKLFKK